jgi:hypothetical protein
MVAGGVAGAGLRRALTDARAADPGAFAGPPSGWGQAAEDRLIQEILDQAADAGGELARTVPLAHSWPSWRPVSGQNPNGFALPIDVLPQQTPAPGGPPRARLFTTRGSFRFDDTDLPARPAGG